MTKSALIDYKKKLLEQVPTAKVLQRGAIEGGNWQPALNQCHENVDIWCRLNPAFSKVRGWLYFDLPGLPVVKFVAHSVVRKPDGILADITPSNASADYPFIESGLSDTEYQEILEQCPNFEINCCTA